MRRGLEAGREGWIGSEGWMQRTRVIRLVLTLLLIGCRLENPVVSPPPVFPPVPPSSPPPSPPPAPAPTPAQTILKVRVTAVTTGVELDPDGYTAEVVNDPDEMMAFHASDTLGTNGSTVLALGPGVYYVYLAGIAPNCTAVEPLESRFIVFWDSTLNPAELPVPLQVICLAIPATQGVRVTTVATGTLPATASFQLGIASDSGAVQPFSQNRPIGANESVTMPSPVGSFGVGLALRGAWLRCTFSSVWQRVLVEPNQMASITFNIACPP